MPMKVVKNTNPNAEKMWVEVGPFSSVAGVVVYKLKKQTREAKRGLPYMWVIRMADDLHIASGLCRLQKGAVQKGTETRDKILVEATRSYATTANVKHSIHLNDISAD